MAKKKKISNLRLARWIVGAIMVFLTGYIGWAHQNTGGDPLDSYCPFGAVETFLTSITTGGKFIPLVSFTDIILFLVIVVVTLIAGGIFCGWLCPFGTLQDWIYKYGQKLGVKSYTVPDKVDKYLRYLKYVVLVAIMYGSYAAVNMVFIEFDPFRAFFHLSIETGLGYVMIGITLVGSLFLSRFWCQYLCPLGAIIAPLSKLGLLRVKKTDKCTSCNLCMKNCNMRLKDIGDLGCNNCMECVSDCPTPSKAIEIKTGPKKTSYSHAVVPITGIILAVVLVVGSMGTGLWETKTSFANMALPAGSPTFYNYPEVSKVVFCTSYFDDAAKVYDLTVPQIYTKLKLDPNQPAHQMVKDVSKESGIPEGDIKKAIEDLVIERGTTKK